MAKNGGSAENTQDIGWEVKETLGSSKCTVRGKLGIWSNPWLLLGLSVLPLCLVIALRFLQFGLRLQATKRGWNTLG
jgi:hypothetical protein